MLRGTLRQLKQPLHTISLTAIAVGLTAIIALNVVNATEFESGYQAYQRGDFTEALKFWRPLAEAGDAKAQFNIGVMCDEGRGLEPDKKAAIE